MLKIAALKETAPFEKRVAITPDIVKKYTAKSIDVFIEQGAGEQAGFSDSEYKEAGAKVSKVPLEILSDADIILKVAPSHGHTKDSLDEINLMREGTILVGLLAPHENKDLIIKYANKKATSFALEMLPRISRAQDMDVLSSQANLAGYRAVIDAFYEYEHAVPMMMTAAGTIMPARVLILGAGVAGLQAIATAKRMGASVFGYDVRPEVKEQVKSLGAKFLEVDPAATQSSSTSGGYAKQMSEYYQEKQKHVLTEAIAKSDIVITTAQIPGKKAPRLIDDEMLDRLKPGSIVVDLAAGSGGNVSATKKDKITLRNGVKIMGYSNMPSRLAHDASKLYAKNLYNFLSLIIDEKHGKITINQHDEIINSCLITHDGVIRI